jgi:hypothetical protein
LISSSNLSRATSPPDNINQSLLNFKVRFEETCGDVHQVVANYIAAPSPAPRRIRSRLHGTARSPSMAKTMSSAPSPIP